MCIRDRNPKDQVINESTIAKFSVAVNRKMKDKNGESKKATTWFNVIAWNRSAEVIIQYFKKGDPILLMGRLDIRNYQDNEGLDKTWVEIVLEKFYFMPKGEGQQNDQSNQKKEKRKSVHDGHRDTKVSTNKDYTAEDIPF